MPVPSPTSNRVQSDMVSILDDDPIEAPGLPATLSSETNALVAMIWQTEVRKHDNGHEFGAVSVAENQFNIQTFSAESTLRSTAIVSMTIYFPAVCCTSKDFHAFILGWSGSI
ncbi:hypothetical protein EMCG_05114 [[Emmonsia] crescens]|uniref:Uncharacterized protein n=1 Tax=[Emmonsia] crescens TaxID=73230 RepID=A0A0G2HQ21_9EURO|nr:hypothetical protein EMCG_05114 [Emmonsia crescens UAMH 3008]